MFHWPGFEESPLIKSIPSIACFYYIFVDYILNFLKSNYKNGSQQKNMCL